MGDFVTNLIGHWRLNDNSGSTTIAASVNNNGTLSGAGNTVDSTFSGPTNYLNKSLFFDGINDGITLTSAGTLSLAQNRSAITLATWIKTSYTGTQQIAMWWSSNNANVARVALSIGSLGEFRGISRCTDADVTQSTSGGFIADGNWHHIASVFNYPNDSITLYIDGQTIDQSGSVSFVGTATSNTSSSNARIGFGSSSSNPGFLLSGYLADARFYNRALTSEDIYSLYQYSESGLIGHWKLDDNNSTTTVMPIVGPTGLLSGAGNTSGSYVLGPGGSLSGAMLFDGTNDIVRLAIGQPFLNRVSGSTVSYWARTTFFPSVNTPVTFVNNNGLPGNSRLAIYCAASTGRLIAAGRAADGELAQTSSGILNYNDGNWHHFAEVVDLANDSISLYVDGVYAPQNSVANFGNVITSSTNPTRVTIGGIDNASTNWFRGHVADVRYYENILSSGNIYDLYSLANIEYPPLSGHWQLFDNEDSSVIQAQAGATGTISGGIYSSLITTSPPGNQITGALYFNSTGINLLNPINSRLLSNQNTISTSCWFKTTGNGQTEYQRIINIYTSAFNTVRLTVALNPEGKIQVLARSSDGESFQIKKTVQSGYNDNNWHHLVTTLDYYNDSINIYVDNSESSSTGTINFSLNNVQNSSSTGFQIGGQDGGYFIGSTADVRIYRGLLSQNNISSLYSLGVANGLVDLAGHSDIYTFTNANIYSDWGLYGNYNINTSFLGQLYRNISFLINSDTHTSENIEILRNRLIDSSSQNKTFLDGSISKAIYIEGTIDSTTDLISELEILKLLEGSIQTYTSNNSTLVKAIDISAITRTNTSISGTVNLVLDMNTAASILTQLSGDLELGGRAELGGLISIASRINGTVNISLPFNVISSTHTSTNIIITRAFNIAGDSLTQTDLITQLSAQIILNAYIDALTKNDATLDVELASSIKELIGISSNRIALDGRLNFTFGLRVSSDIDSATLANLDITGLQLELESLIRARTSMSGSLVNIVGLNLLSQSESEISASFTVQSTLSSVIDVVTAMNGSLVFLQALNGEILEATVYITNERDITLRVFNC